MSDINTTKKGTKMTNNSNYKEKYTLKCDWPMDCFVQGGDSGIVLGAENYITAYFEAFPKDIECFIRGEGKTLDDAEQNAFNKYTRYRNCPKHEFEHAKGYKNGMGKCKHCGLMTIVFEEDYTCILCGDHHCCVSVDKQYEKDENSCLCEKCFKKPENIKYAHSHILKFEIMKHNGFFKNPFDMETCKKLSTRPNTLDEFFEILNEDSNYAMKEYFRRKRLEVEKECDDDDEILARLFTHLFEQFVWHSRYEKDFLGEEC